MRGKILLTVGMVSKMSHLRSFNRFILTSLALLGLSVSSANAATYEFGPGVFGNELLGANGVIVNGLTYNVSFLDGSCASIYDGCDELSDFTFNSAADADAASQALIDQVFNLSDIYDIFPHGTRGIEFTSYGEFYTPYGFSSINRVSLDGMRNSSGANPDLQLCGIGGCSLGLTEDITSFQQLAYAQWTQVSPVPVPAAIWLFGTALMGLVGFSKRRKAA